MCARRDFGTACRSAKQLQPFCSGLSRTAGSGLYACPAQTRDSSLNPRCLQFPAIHLTSSLKYLVWVYCVILFAFPRNSIRSCSCRLTPSPA
ncbi:hypothetical protein CC78DRAFT_86705 [Lojkania enalia]|uniref:Uncharacterized protein n=1 Tax=Lojkania enalia TaxID=147567 RepID=A0A9P4N1S4_9PLEO|nr:hypothetical protein CC78DRAFT_86705 [Didymosphaeria enalia]